MKGQVRTILIYQNAVEALKKLKYTLRKHLRTKVTPDIVKIGKSGVGIKMIKMDNFNISP